MSPARPLSYLLRLAALALLAGCGPATGPSPSPASGQPAAEITITHACDGMAQSPGCPRSGRITVTGSDASYLWQDLSSQPPGRSVCNLDMSLFAQHTVITFRTGGTTVATADSFCIATLTSGGTTRPIVWPSDPRFLALTALPPA